jgi:hypothetical protein
VYEKGDKPDCKNYRGICQLNVAYKIFAKVLHTRLLPYANAVVQHYQTGFQSGKSTTDQLCERFWKKATNSTTQLIISS